MRLEKKAQYISAVKINKNILIYENNYKTVMTNVYVNGVKQNIFANSGVCHNFSIFQNDDGWVYGIGGVQSWKARRGGLRHADGLYLFRSKNGVNWEQVQYTPVITAEHKGFNSCLAWKSGEFDSHLFIQKNNGIYFLYVRDNVGVQRRWLQYSTSNDLLNWNEFKPVNLNYDPEINTYFMVGGLWQGKHVCMVPQFDNSHGWIRVFESSDMVNFLKIKDILYRRGQILIGKNKNVDHPVNGIIDGHCYIHHDYMTDKSNIMRYHLSEFL